jgi:cyclohexanone monooxygenase
MSTTNGVHQPRIAVIGAGPGGICAAIRLREAGFTDLTIYERSDSIGGTWNHNRYPGAACDVQSHLYSFSFALKTDWTRPYATQPEILRYFEHVVERFDLRPLIRFSSTVTSAQWDEQAHSWQLVLNGDQHVEADIVISAIGMFNDLTMPAIDGLDVFEGTLFHSARWDTSHDLAGERIAVIGTAASAVQFLPYVAQQAGELVVFQRTPNWVLPKEDTPYTPDELERFATDPDAAREVREGIFTRIEATITFSNPDALQAAEDAGRHNLETVIDPDVRAKLTPTEPWGCRRPLSSNTYYPVFNQPNVELVTDPVERLTPKGVVTVDGREREVDTVILGTGFATTKYASSIDFRGRDGQPIAEAWADGAQAYLGITTAGFPNLFMLYGPNTNNGSILFMIECQVAYVQRQLERMTGEGIASIDVKPEVMHDYNEQLQHDIDQVKVWNENCNTGYYRGGTSQRIVTQWPHTMVAYRERTQQIDDDAYETAFSGS